MISYKTRFLFQMYLNNEFKLHSCDDVIQIQISKGQASGYKSRDFTTKLLCSVGRRENNSKKN